MAVILLAIQWEMQPRVHMLIVGVNPDLKWETQTMINLGADASFFSTTV